MMGKRQVVVSSSDDEDGNCLGSATCGSSKSTLRTPDEDGNCLGSATCGSSKSTLRTPDEDGNCLGSATCGSSKSTLRTRAGRKKSKASKKVVGLDTQLCNESHKLEPKFDKLFEDFYGGLQVNVVPGYGWRDTKELWADKYKPRSLPDLAVHKKKIDEVKKWLEERVRNPKEDFHNHALLITGQAGVGKSATIHAIASQLGAELYEWKAPTPTLWQEHIHNSSSGTCYMSKLDEFENFVERIRKYPLLSLASTAGSKKSVIILVDDLPMANGRVAFERLRKCLHSLAQFTRTPTVILITEYSKADSVDSTARYSEELQSSLERAGASKVAFNSVTVNSIKKTLSRICREEHYNVTAEWIEQIAKASGGDIRHAITSLQYFCLQPESRLSLPAAPLTTSTSKVKSEGLNAFPFSSVSNEEDLDGGFSLSFGRDETLSLFHALGKFLHNKRETTHSARSGKDLLLQGKFMRFPLKMDAPEKVLCQAHGQARPTADFLHENVLDFLNNEAIDDAWIVASYLSDADYLLATGLHGSMLASITTGKYDSESVAQSIATSVAVRGVLYGNSHPSPSRWHSIRSPKLWQVEQSSNHNKNQMAKEKIEAYHSFGSSDISVIATEYRPSLKWLGLKASEGLEIHKKPIKESKLEEDETDWMDPEKLDGETSGESEADEIEDW